MAAVTCQAVDLDSPAQYLPTFRPWFALLGVRLRPRSEHVKQVSVVENAGSSTLPLAEAASCQPHTRLRCAP